MAKDDADLITPDNEGNLTITLPRRIDMQVTSALWERYLALQKKYKPNQLIVEANAVDYCDGAGIALLLELEKRQTQQNHKFTLENLATQFITLLQTTRHTTTEQTPQKKPDLCTKTGIAAWAAMKNWRKNITFTGELSAQIFFALLHPKRIRAKDVWRTMETVGPGALPITALLGFLLGLILAFQATIPLERFGADVYVINLVGISLVRELGPLMAGIVLAGRTASAFAAELGTMKVNQEIDALHTMGVNPLRFLIIPRAFAAIIMMPFLTVYLIIFGFIGCYVVMASLGFGLHYFIDRLFSSFTIIYFMGGLIKAFVFGILIASIGCLHGLKTREGAIAVGQSTTQAVVTSIIMLAVADGIFAVIFYVLGV